VAFLFLTNSDLTFAPLWQRFFAGHADRLNVYVHADPPSWMLLPSTSSFRGRLVAAWPMRCGDPRLITVAQRLLDDAANAYFALLSQHCHHRCRQVEGDGAGGKEASFVRKWKAGIET
jgi:hypothetical protein